MSLRYFTGPISTCIPSDTESLLLYLFFQGLPLPSPTRWIQRLRCTLCGPLCFIIYNYPRQATRSPNSCADPSLVQTVYQAFNAPGTTHQLNWLYAFDNSNSASATLTFANELPAFKAWPSQQDFLFPLSQLASTTTTHVIYALGASAASPPIIAGFVNQGIIAWAYSTQVCNSVPLLSATLAGATDTHYTIDPFVHSGLVADGWNNDGVVAFVLPL